MSGMTQLVRHPAPIISPSAPVQRKKVEPGRSEFSWSAALPQVYQVAAALALPAALLASISAGWAGLMGVLYGVALALASLRTAELVVRGTFRPGMEFAFARLAVLLFLKLLLMTILLSGAVWLAEHRMASLIAVVAGVALVHSIILVKAATEWLFTVSPSEGTPLEAEAGLTAASS